MTGDKEYDELAAAYLQSILETLKTLEPYSTLEECIEKLQARIDAEREVA